MNFIKGIFITVFVLLFLNLSNAQTYATLPFSDDLSSGSLGSSWSFSDVQGMGTYAVTDLSGGWPKFGTCNASKCSNVGATGGNGVIVYNSSNPTGSNQLNMDLHLNLGSAGAVELSQALVDWRSGWDSIGIWLSNDGGTSFTHATTIKLWLSPYTDGVWNELTLDLTSLAASTGVSFSSTYVVRYATFLQYVGSSTSPKSWPNQSVYFDNFKGEELAALPVELTSFTGAVTGNTTELYWQTESEVNNSHFEIQRSSDGIVWETIGVVEGMGDSNVKNAYNFVDNSNYYTRTFYRLKQVDYDGEFEYTNVIAFNSENNQPELQVLNNGRSPVLKVKGLANAEIQILSMSGQSVWIKKAIDGYWMDLDFLDAGNYIVMVNTSNGPISEKITVVK